MPQLVVFSAQLSSVLLELEGMAVQRCVAIQKGVLLLYCMVQLVLPERNLLPGTLSNGLQCNVGDESSAW